MAQARFYFLKSVDFLLSSSSSPAHPSLSLSFFVLSYTKRFFRQNGNAHGGSERDAIATARHTGPVSRSDATPRDVTVTVRKCVPGEHTRTYRTRVSVFDTVTAPSVSATRFPANSAEAKKKVKKAEREGEKEQEGSGRV